VIESDGSSRRSAMSSLIARSRAARKPRPAATSRASRWAPRVKVMRTWTCCATTSSRSAQRLESGTGQAEAQKARCLHGRHHRIDACQHRLAGLQRHLPAGLTHGAAAFERQIEDKVITATMFGPVVRSAFRKAGGRQAQKSPRNMVKTVPSGGGAAPVGCDSWRENKVPPQWDVLAALHTFWGGSACPAGRALERRGEYDGPNAQRNPRGYDHSVTEAGYFGPSPR